VSIRKYRLLFLAVLAAPVLPAQTVLLNDTFSTATNSGSNMATVGPQGTQSPPSSAEWFLIDSTNASATYTNGSPGSLAQVIPSTANSAVIAYFETPGNQQTLNVGDSIAINVSFTVSGPTNVADGIGFGLFNSGSTALAPTQLGANLGGTTSGNFASYAGIAALINPNVATTATTTDLDSRATGSNDLTSLASYTAINSPTGTATIGTDNYMATLSLTYAGAGNMGVGFTLNDTTTSTTVAAYSAAGTTSTFPTQFDTVFIDGQALAATTLTLSTVNVVFTPVPEPPVYVLCGGGLAVLAAASSWRRRRAARAA